MKPTLVQNKSKLLNQQIIPGFIVINRQVDCSPAISMIFQLSLQALFQTFSILFFLGLASKRMDHKRFPGCFASERDFTLPLNSWPVFSLALTLYPFSKRIAVVAPITNHKTFGILMLQHFGPVVRERKRNSSWRLWDRSTQVS